MQPLLYDRAADAPAAVKLAGASHNATAPQLAPAQFLAGGTTMLDLMKLDVMRPTHLVDINNLRATCGTIEVTSQGLKLGALVTMAEAAANADIQRDYPVIAQSLQLAASAQLRNMASLGGNVLQRTRCAYFRDPSWAQCNKRKPGSGCAALTGVNRKHAVLGVSESCIASYPGDFAQALVALDAVVEITGPGGARTLPFAQLHRNSDTPAIETALAPDEIITGFTVPAGAHARRSLYVKVRDRESYEFGLCTAVVALDLAPDGTVNDARIALGGVAYKPWRATQAEAALKGQKITLDTARAAAQLAFAGAVAHGENAYKIPLGQRTVVRALFQAAALEI